MNTPITRVGDKGLSPGIEDEVIDAWQSHDWPGNVREFENAVERAVVMCKGKVLSLSDIQMPQERLRKESAYRQAAPFENGTGVTFNVGVSLDDVERELILKTLESESGNRTNTAEILGISVRTLRNKLAQYGEMDAFK